MKNVSILIFISVLIIIGLGFLINSFSETFQISNWIKNDAKRLVDVQIGKSNIASSLQNLASDKAISSPIIHSISTNETISHKTPSLSVWPEKVFGAVIRTSIDQSSGDRIPPSFRRTFESTEFPLTINGTNYRLDQLNDLSTVQVEIGKPLKLQIRMYENEGTNNIQHVTLYLNQHGPKILNDLTETGITFEKGKPTKITDPYNLIENATIIQSIEGIKDVFEFELKFAKEMNTSDLLFRIWDFDRNNVDMYIPEILAAVTVSHLENKQSDALQESVTKSENSDEIDQIFFAEIFDKWAGYSNIFISDEEFLHYLKIKGKHIPNWIKQYNAKWVHDGNLTQYDLVTALKNMEGREMLNSKNLIS